MSSLGELLDALTFLLGFILFSQFCYAGFYAWREVKSSRDDFTKAILLFSASAVLAGLYAIIEVVLRHLPVYTEWYAVIGLKVWRVGIYGLGTFAVHLIIQTLRKEKNNDI